MTLPRFHLGLRAHDFGRLPTAELAQKIGAAGFRVVQLAPFRGLADLPDDINALTPARARAIRNVFADHGVRIGVLSCYVNIGTGDAAERDRLVERYQRHLAVAREIGAEMVATETGSVNSDWSWHEANRDEATYARVLDTVLALVSEAERVGANVGIEGVVVHIFNSLERMHRLVEATRGHRNLRVIFDTFNLLTAATAHDHRAIIRRGFDLLGPAITTLHLKDYQVEDGKLVMKPVGRGDLDFGYLLAQAATLPRGLDLMLEEHTPDIASPAAAHLRAVAPANAFF